MTSSVSATGAPRGWMAMALSVGVTAFGGMPIWLLSAFAPTMGPDLGFDSVGLGLIIGGFFGLCALMSMPLGRVVEHLGWQRGMSLSFAAATLCLVTIGALAQSWAALAVALVVGAVANITSQPASNLAISQVVAAGRRGVALGVKQAALPLATLLVGFSVPLFGSGGDWHWAFFCAAAIAAMLAALAVTRPRDPASAVSGTRRRWRCGLSMALGRAAAPTRVGRPLVLLGIGAGLGTAATMSLGGFLATYAVTQGLSLPQAGQLIAVGSGVGIASRVLSGVIADARGRGHETMVAGMMLAGAVGLGMIAISDSLPLLLIGSVLAFGLGWAWNGVFHLAVITGTSGSPAAATGVVQTAMAVGAMVGPTAFGFAVTLSFALGWLLAAVLMVLAAVLVLLSTLPRLGPSR